MDIPADYFNRQRVLVLGNSGSLLEQPRQEHWPSDLLVVGTNRILRKATDGRIYNPHVLVISDGRVLESDRESIEAYQGILILSQWVGWERDCIRFTSRPSRRQWYRQDIPLSRFPKTLQGTYPHINNVAFQACLIAFCFCAEGGTVYLAGCEDRWPPRGDPRRKRHHTYSDLEIPKSHQPFAVNPYMARQWAPLSAHFKRYGRNLVDVSPWRDLALPGLERGEFPG